MALCSGFKCKASTVTVQPWGYSGAYQNTVSVNILNTGTSAVAQPYTITVASSKYQKLAQVLKSLRGHLFRAGLML